MTGPDPVTTRVMTVTDAVNEAMALQDAGRLADARHLFEAVIAKQPAHAIALHQLGLIAAALADLPQAIRRMSEAVEANPRFVEAYSNLGTFLLDYGDPEKAATAFRTALMLRPDLWRTHRLLLQCLLYLPGLTPEQRFAEHLAFGRAFDDPPDGALPPPANDRDPDRQLRVGIVSSDFAQHPVAENLFPVLANRDPASVAITLYAHVSRSDPYTALCRQRADGWRDITGLSDRQAAELVRADGIDLLMIVAGRFDRNRPLIAPYRPAPVQISYGDCATTGLAAMDYAVSDPVMSPADSTERFCETVVHLPVLQNLPIPPTLPDIGPLPALANDFVTFGSFNRPAKVNAAVVALWAALLHAVPTARLVFGYRRHFSDPGMRARFRTAFGSHGVAPDRLMFPDGEMPYLETYRTVDIALDPFPFNGSMTSFDALTMGVPVLTRAGDTQVSRVSASQLTAVGLDGLVAHSDSDFIKIGTALAGDLKRLVALRAGLRARVAASPLCDGVAYARSMERLWRDVWQRWCASASGA